MTDATGVAFFLSVLCTYDGIFFATFFFPGGPKKRKLTSAQKYAPFPNFFNIMIRKHKLTFLAFQSEKKLKRIVELR